MPNNLKFIVTLLVLWSTSSGVGAQPQAHYSVGESQICVLSDDGEVTCTVSPGFKRLLPPSNLPQLTAVSTGDSHACGITVDGRAVCWGDNSFNQLDSPTTSLPLTQINAGHNHTCAVDTAGQAHCWGLNTNKQTEPPAGALFTKVHAAFTSSCGILVNGDISCWSTDGERAPSDLSGPFIDLDMQTQGVCGLTASGNVVCNSLINSLVPVLTNGPYIDLATTFGAVCGLKDNNTLDCNTARYSFTGLPDFDDYPLGESFVSIQSVETGFSGIGNSREFGLIGTTLCGERFDGNIDCWSPSALFPDLANDSASSAESTIDMRLDMDARIYGVGSVEIFWTPVSQAGVDVEVEIFRNGVLLERTPARQSYVDRAALIDNVYQIRLVSDLGLVGSLSPELVVNTQSNTILFNGELPVSASRQNAFTAESIFTSLNSTAASRGSLVYWTIESDQQPLIDGYEIELNGQRVGFTRSQMYLNLQERVSSCLRVSAMGFDGAVLDTTHLGSSCQ